MNAKKLIIPMVLLLAVVFIFSLTNTELGALIQGKIMRTKSTSVNNVTPESDFSAYISGKNKNITSCPYFNEVRFTDPTGDVVTNKPSTTPGFPSNADIKSLTVRQLGKDVQFVWEGGGSLFNTNRQYYFIFIDTDLNPNTGQNGGEIKLTVDSSVTMGRFDATGNLLSTVHDIPIIFDGNKFYINLSKSTIGTDNFNITFNTSGGTPYSDSNQGGAVSLASGRDLINVSLTTARPALLANPFLANIVAKNTTIQLKTYASINNGVKILVPKSLVRYNVGPAVDNSGLGNPSSIISIDNQGNAKYLKVGYVLASPIIGNCYFPERNIIATGNKYTNNNSTISIFPADFKPTGSNYSFGDMMNSNPDFQIVVDLIYNLESELYKGFKPRNGEKQILAVLNIPNHCAGNGNPLRIAPGCLMDLGSGVPNYGVIGHEMGHNFAENKGLSLLLGAENGRLDGSGFGECVASLPEQYIRQMIYNNPESYGISRNSNAYTNFAAFQVADNADNKIRLQTFEGYINTGKISGIFDINNGNLTNDEINAMGGDVGAYCSLFVPYAAYSSEFDNFFGWDLYPRFLGLFSDRDLPNFDKTKPETYFGAAYSAAMGKDMRDKLRFWGFVIDDNYFDQMYPYFGTELNRK